jgi:histidinol-phosphate/aromatic aminotransferase/cobyric acid decarboxylase-like protein
LARVGFVIVAEQVQDAVKDEDAHFVIEGAAEALGVAASDRGGDGDIAKIFRR